jgi:hypothetical protein
MITVSVKPRPRERRMFLRRRQTVLAVFSYRYDAHLVPDLIANIDPLVDGWIAFDDRASTEVFSSEPLRQRTLLQAAREARADWILAVDPDERFEARTAARIARMTRKRGRVAWGFNLREMHSPDAYRIDGIWGKKKSFRLFRSFDPAEKVEADLHDVWYPRGGFREVHSDLNLYHLKMIEPRRRIARRDLYNFLDPDLRYQAIGYDYLADATGARFETIPAGRHFLPPHADDGGLWMPDVAQASA